MCNFFHVSAALSLHFLIGDVSIQCPLKTGACCVGTESVRFSGYITELLHQWSPVVLALSFPPLKLHALTSGDACSRCTESLVRKNYHAQCCNAEVT